MNCENNNRQVSMATEKIGPGFTFAQKLVGNEQPEREEALAGAVEWIKNQKELSEDQALAIWHVFYHSLWMTDRPLVQHAYCDKLSNIINEIPENFFEKFSFAYFKTMIENWKDLDKHRVDKFLVLGRKFIYSFVDFCHNHNKLPIIPETINNVFKLPGGPGFKNHIVDVIVDRLPNLVQIDPSKGYEYLDPFVNVYCFDHAQSSLAKRINDRIVQPIIDSLGTIFYGEGNDEYAQKYIRNLSSNLHKAVKNPDPNISMHNLRIDSNKEVRQIVAAINRLRASEGKPIVKAD